MSALHRDAGNTSLLFLSLVSFFGLILVALFIVNPPVSQEDFVWRKSLVGSIFASVCVLGSLAVFFPNTCSRSFNFGKGEARHTLLSLSFRGGFLASPGGQLVLRGHHPRCGRFSSHVFDFGGRTFCATCSGLFLGALVVLVGVAVVFFGNLQIEKSAFWVVWVGVLGVTLALLQAPLLKVQRSFVRVFSSALLAVGSFLILIVIDELARSFFLDVFLVSLTVLWLVTRISLSQWEHEKTCTVCGSASNELRDCTKK